MNLLPEPFEAIMSGNKLVEIRLYDEKRRRIKIGDSITFKLRDNPTQSFEVEVIGLLHYGTFTQLYDDLGSRFFPDYNDRASFLESIYQIYTPEQEKTYGVLAIRIKKQSK